MEAIMFILFGCLVGSVGVYHVRIYIHDFMIPQECIGSYNRFFKGLQILFCALFAIIGFGIMYGGLVCTDWVETWKILEYGTVFKPCWYEPIFQGK